MDERAAFEKWFAGRYPNSDHAQWLARFEDDGMYRDVVTEALWDGWQARASMAVPQPIETPCVEFTKRFVSDFEGDHVWKGEIVDKPRWSPLTDLYERAKAALTSSGSVEPKR